MAKNFHDHIIPNIWPLFSSDLNPLDYYVWIIVEREVNKHFLNTKDSLKAAIVKIMSNINKIHLIQACQRFRSHIEAIIEAESGFIK